MLLICVNGVIITIQGIEKLGNVEFKEDWKQGMNDKSFKFVVIAMLCMIAAILVVDTIYGMMSPIFWLMAIVASFAGLLAGRKNKEESNRE